MSHICPVLLICAFDVCSCSQQSVSLQACQLHLKLCHIYRASLFCPAFVTRSAWLVAATVKQASESPQCLMHVANLQVDVGSCVLKLTELLVLSSGSATLLLC